ncbi:hypothetical protein NSS82_19150 [Paenibacillus sp. FSL H7-0735]|uniref:hypothetical protein n=1 Tax=Paenibacillus sp. FSL H7-0735 TaxID=2954736 RepID=UPI0030F921C0
MINEIQQKINELKIDKLINVQTKIEDGVCVQYACDSCPFRMDCLQDYDLKEIPTLRTLTKIKAI